LTGTAYHQLGSIAEERRDFDAAEKWYLKSLAISEKQGNKHLVAGTYHQLGIVAQKRRDFEAAEKWYLKSLAIEAKQGNEHGAASTHGQLGILAQLRGDYLSSAAWLIRCVHGFLHTRDSAGAERNTRNFLIAESAAPAELRPRLRTMWADAGLPPLPEVTQNQT